MSCDPSSNGFQATTIYVIGGDGNVLGEEDGSGNWMKTDVWAAGELIATYKDDGLGVHFQLSDWLGTHRVQTDYLGQAEGNCSNDPFGDWLLCTPGQATNLDFTGYEHDQESGLDFAQARYYQAPMSRFMSPDPDGGSMDFSNPQSLNRYSYVGNMPLTMTDPSGRHRERTSLAFERSEPIWFALAQLNFPSDSLQNP